MLQKKRFWVVSTILLFILNLCTIGWMWFFVYSKPSPKTPSFNPDPLLGMAHHLKLSDQQRDSLKSKVDFSVRRKIYGQLMIIRHTILQEATKENPDSAKIDSLVKEISHLQGLSEREVFYELRTLRKVADPNQRERFGRMVNRMGRRMQSQRSAAKSDSNFKSNSNRKRPSSQKRN